MTRRQASQSERSGAPGTAGRSALVLTVFILAAAAFLRLWRVGLEGLWCDEAYTAHLMTQPWKEMIALLWRHDDAPPLFYLLQRPLTALWGDSEAGLRLLPAACGVAAVAVLAADGLRRRVPARLWSAAFLAIAPLAVFYARQSRSYGLMLLLALIVMLANEAMLSRGRRGAAIWLAVAGALLCLTHHIGVVLLAASLLAWPLRGPSSVSLRRWAVAHGAPLLVWAALWTASAAQFETHTALNTWMAGYWQTRSLWLAPLLSLVAFTPGALPASWSAVAFPTAPWPGPFWPTLAGLAALAAILTALLAGRRRRSRPATAEPATDPHAPWREAVFLLLPLGALALASLIVTPVYVVGRTDVIAFPAFALLLGRGLARMPRGGALTALLLWSVLSVASLAPTYGLRASARAKGADRDLAGFMAAQGLRESDWVVHGFLTAPSLEYYLRRQGAAHRAAWFPPEAGENIAGVAPTPLDSLDHYLADARRLRARMDAAMAPGDAVWILALLPETPRGRPSKSDPGAASAEGVAYPHSLLLYALLGGREAPLLRVYRQDWVGGRRALLRVARRTWVDLDSLPPLLTEPAAQRDAAATRDRSPAQPQSPAGEDAP